MSTTIVDTNVLVSHATDRNLEQQRVSEELFRTAFEGDVELFIPDFVFFEVSYVLTNLYEFPERDVSEYLQSVSAQLGVMTAVACDWARTLDLWPKPFGKLPDAAIAAIAVRDRSAVATFDKSMAKGLKKIGVSIWAP